MVKKDILNLIENFEKETWKYDDNDKLDNDMQYIYSIEKEIQNINETNLKPIFDKLISMIGIIRFKYGFESIIIKSNPELESLKKIIDDISLNSNNTINQYNYISTIYNNFINENKNMDFIENKYLDIWGKEGLYLAVESLKSLITSDQYRELLNNNQINTVLTDCIKLNNGITDIRVIELRYKEIIKKIWEHSLSNSIDENGKFRILFSNISGGNFIEQANSLVNRPYQSSCSMISSDFIAIYGSDTRKIGFIYPNNSEIIMTSAYDLASNVFGSGSDNKEKGTLLSTPDVLEKIGMKRAKDKSQDLHSSNCYNEILINGKPCGIAVIGLGEGDLNIYYREAHILSSEMNLPIYFVDTMKYKDKLSDVDRDYIAFHSIVSYLGINANDLLHDVSLYGNIYKLINVHKNTIADAFITLKTNGNLSKDNMCQLMSNIIDISETNVKSR